jgi:radical SAM superfamily enzyme YgiQ (UPF0313 family)
MHDVVLIHVPYMFNTNPPLAAPLLKACLAEHGISAYAIDFNIEFINSNISTKSIISWLQKPDLYPNKDEYVTYKNWVEKSVKRVLELNPKWIGISVFTKDSQLAAEDFACAIRKLSPTTKILVGGLGANVNLGQWNLPWYQLAFDSNLVDAVIIGEGEKSIVDVIKNDITGIVKAPQLNVTELDAVPMPNFSDYTLSNYYSDLDNDVIAIPITASKGCIRDCTFCDVGKHWPNFNSRSGTKVASEIISFYTNYGFKYFRFTDSLINGNVKEFRIMNKKLCDELPNTVKYRGQFICRPKNQMPLEDFKLMAKAGAYRVQIGIESGSEAVRHHMRKKFSNNDIEYSTYALYNNGIKQSWFIFVGYPTETLNDFKETLKLVEKYKNLAKDQMVQIIPTGVFQMLDGTPIAEQDMLTALEIEQHTVGGYQTYAWTSKLYPENTFVERARRFKELVELCKSYELISEFEDMVEGHLKMINYQELKIIGGNY